MGIFLGSQRICLQIRNWLQLLFSLNLCDNYAVKTKSKWNLNSIHFIKKSIFGAASLSLLPSNSFTKLPLKDIQLTILHTNDTHSQIEPFSSGKYKGLGGMAQRSSIVKKIRSEGNPVLLFDAGDIFQGTPYYNFFKGELELKLMKMSWLW